MTSPPRPRAVPARLGSTKVRTVLTEPWDRACASGAGLARRMAAGSSAAAAAAASASSSPPGPWAAAVASRGGGGAHHAMPG
eukprot:scaffold14484_cov54-Phaeocystis_antarctica.AAC.4